MAEVLKATGMPCDHPPAWSSEQVGGIRYRMPCPFCRQDAFDLLRSSTSAFLAFHTQIAAQSFGGRDSEGKPIWNDDMWRTEDPDEFGLVEELRATMDTPWASTPTPVSGPVGGEPPAGEPRDSWDANGSPVPMLNGGW